MTERELPPLPPTPAAGSLWRHKKTGGVYRIVCIASDSETLVPVVVYRSSDYGAADAGKTWIRPWSEFTDGRFEEV